ncbi:hypothetical protein BH09BAC2_BH09BAC2_21670 [soil metagenome]
MKTLNIPFYFLFIVSAICFAQKSFAQIEFIENKGQWKKEVAFMSNAGNGAFFLQKKGFTIVQYDAADMARLQEKVHGHKRESITDQNVTIKSHAYNVEFVNGNPDPEIVPDKPLPTINNYFIGNDPAKWAINCKTFQAVTYKNVYPGIDVRFYSDGAERLKYDIIAAPGSDINKIALRYNGAQKLSIKNKELLISTSIGENKELYPYSYQYKNNQRNEIKTSYHLKGNVVKFKVEDYSPENVLIIDPTQIFFTYTGSTADNWGFTATYGPDGSFFSGGIVFGNGFPVSTGAFQTTFKGGDYDIGIMKLSPDGSKRLYATYIGGNGKDQPHSLIADAQGNLIVAGRTNSSDYPTTGTLGSGGSWDIIVTKLNATGSALIGSMKIGGTGDDGVNIKDRNSTPGTQSLNRNYGDDARSEVILDASNNIYVASSTSGGFPVTPGAFQTSYGGGAQDAVVLKINPNANAVIWSTYLGGSNNDAAYVLALGTSNNLYVCGGTASSNLKGISPAGVIQSGYSGGDCDGYIIELSTDGIAALKGTYLGTVAADQIYGVQTDKTGNVYVMGTTEGSWQIINANSFGPTNSKQFISKLQPDLSAYIYSTVFGTGTQYPNISPTAFLVDRCENVYVSGWGGKSNTLEGYNTGTVTGMPVTADAIKKTSDPSGSDFYFFVMEKNAASQLYGTFFGQLDPLANANPITFGDHVDGGTSRFDKNGVIYQAMCANCNRTVSFTGTPGSWSPNNKALSGGKCNLGMLKIAMNFAGVSASPRSSINGIDGDTSGCIPLTVDFIDVFRKGKTYVWNFGDGSPSVTTTAYNISHTYNNVGRYRVMLVAIDPATCNVSDTAYLTIKAGDNKAKISFVSNKLPPCTSLTYRFDNTSTASTASFGSSSFIWDFGDGTAPVPAGTESVTHSFAGAGTYQVKLNLVDTSFCNSPDQVINQLRVSPVLRAAFTTPAKGCIPYTADFINTSTGGLNFTWDFGDGTSSTDVNASHLYPNPGTYNVVLYAFDSTACNPTDTAHFTIKVYGIPTADFSYSPNPPQENTYTQFQNLSTGATSYLWNFGDDEASGEENPKHLFIETGTFNVCLEAINDAGCSNTICLPVQALINPLLDVPSAFTPGRFGINGIVRVMGFGVKKMEWNIYNRWGQKVFESTSVKFGWDGTYKGKLQPMDVYTYTLDATLSGGERIRKTGDITLIR